MAAPVGHLSFWAKSYVSCKLAPNDMDTVFWPPVQSRLGREREPRTREKRRTAQPKAEPFLVAARLRAFGESLDRSGLAQNDK